MAEEKNTTHFSLNFTLEECVGKENTKTTENSLFVAIFFRFPFFWELSKGRHT